MGIHLSDEIVFKIASFLESLFQDPFSSKVAQMAILAGKFHRQKGVDPYSFMCAFERLRRSTIEQIEKSKANEKRTLFDLSSRILSYCMSLAIKSYFDAMVSKVERFNRIHEILRSINQLLFQEYESEAHFFNDICRILAGAYPLVWVGLLSEDGDKIVPVACADSPACSWGCELVKKQNLSISQYLSEGFEEEVKSFFEGNAVLVQNIGEQLTKNPERKSLAEMGCSSVAVLPVFSDNSIVGGIFIYGAEKTISKDDLPLLTEISRDISLGWLHLKKRKQLEKTLFFDELTGIGNIKYFFETLEHEIEIARNGKLKLLIARVDVDGLSVINHSLGYSAGDAILKEMAKRLTELVGPKGTASRTGADDFSASYLAKGSKEVRSFLFELKEKLQEPFRVSGRPVKVTTSVGLALYPDDAEDKESLFDKATLALKRAQDAGPGGVFFYSEERTAEVVKRYHLLEELERAFKNREFVLHFQPRISMKTRRPCGFEALIRWLHPQRGLIPPSEFIATLEESGLMVDVGFWVIEESVEFLRRIEKILPDAVVSFNTSVNQFLHGDFVSRVREILHRKGADPSRLEMEITERVFLKVEEGVQEVLEGIQQLGMKISIDDFGTGYSSMLYLKRLPAHCLKIDYTFIRGIPDEREDVDVVMAIANLARSFGKRTVAEGVETKEQLALLTGIGVDEAQGFYFARPLPEDEAVEFIREYRQERFFWRSKR